jgi:dTDP-glucose 4,6-dehydratase
MFGMYANAMKVLVTGSGGFLGQALVAVLKQRGHKVYKYDLEDGCDILDKQQLLSTLIHSHADVVVHLAACANLNVYATDPIAFRKVNVGGTRIVLDCCEAVGARMLFASTCCCYGNNGVHPSDEDSPVAPTEPYAQSKRDSELEIMSRGGPHCIMRLATFYGSDMRAALAPAIFLAAAYHGTPIKIHGSGTQTRTLTHVDDIVNGIVCILESPKRHSIVNITTQEQVSVLGLIDMVQNVVGVTCDVVHVEDRAGQIHHEEIKADSLRSMGWEPKVSLREGIEAAYRAFCARSGKWGRD